MGRNRFLQNLAVFCGYPAKIRGFLQFSGANLRPPNPLGVVAERSRKSAKMCKLRVRFLPFQLSPFWRMPLILRTLHRRRVVARRRWSAPYNMVLTLHRWGSPYASKEDLTLPNAWYGNLTPRHRLGRRRLPPQDHQCKMHTCTPSLGDAPALRPKSDQRIVKNGPENRCRAKIVEKCRNIFDTFWRFLTIFDVICPARKLSKSVEKLFDTFWRFLTFLTWPLSAGPFCNPLKIAAFSNRKTELPPETITHTEITELIPKQFRFGNSSTQITEYNSQNNSVRDLVFLCSHFFPRLS